MESKIVSKEDEQKNRELEKPPEDVQEGEGFVFVVLVILLGFLILYFVFY